MTYSKYYEIVFQDGEWVAFDPYARNVHYQYVASAFICSSTNRDDCIACVEAMGYLWAGV